MIQQHPQRDAGKDKAGAASAGLAPLAPRNVGARIAAFAVIAVAWIVLDQTVKAQLDVACPGTVMSGTVAGFFRLLLVHNTGGAWSMFAGATFALGAFSVLMCAALTAFLVVERRKVSWPEVVGLALVVGGGIGNAIDRFVLGYVVDFIDLTFMSFPVFNIADIGVTCGLCLFLVAWLVRERKTSRIERQEEGR